MVSAEELECGCCYELLLNPTTLTCGHSFCRYCLAKWFKFSQKTECPECRQMWSGFPQINIRLRSIIEKSLPEKTKVRMRTQENLVDYQDILQKFEEYGKDGGGPKTTISEEQVKTLIGVILLVLAVVVIALLIGIFYWIFFAEAKPSEVIYSKSVQHWSVREVVSWVQVFSGKLDYDYSDRFKKAGIKGELLLSLNKEDLESPPLNISKALHRKIILAEIAMLHAAGVKQANDLWEYKNAHRTSTLFLQFMLQDFPRLTIFYYRFTQYESVYLPFVRAVTAKQQCEEMDMGTPYENDYFHDEVEGKTCSKEEFTTMDRMFFYLKVMVFPYYLVSKFSWHYVHIHTLTMLIIISHCVMLTVREFLQLGKARISANSIVTTIIDAICTFFISSLLFNIAAWFIPTIILDFVFYAKLYYGPLDTAGSIKNGHLRTNAIAKVLNLVYGVVEKILAGIRVVFNRPNDADPPLIRPG